MSHRRVYLRGFSFCGANKKLPLMKKSNYTYRYLYQSNLVDYLFVTSDGKLSPSA